MPALPSPCLASQIAALVGGQLAGADVTLSRVAPLHESSATDIAFLDRGPAAGHGALFARAPVEGRTVIVVADPLLAMIQLLEREFPETPPGAQSVHPRARVHPSAVLHPGVVVGPAVEIGADTVLFPNVVVYANTRIGARVRIHAGAVIGADGFRYHPTAAGLRKVPHVGGVRIDDDAEIGANTCIDRGMLGDTTIGRGAKLDNLVQVGHNCQIGAHSVLVSQVGLSGSIRVGAGAILAGQVGVKDHVRIGAGARIGARSAVHGDVPDGETWLGEPARPVREAMRIYAGLRYLPELVKKLGR